MKILTFIIFVLGLSFSFFDAHAQTQKSAAAEMGIRIAILDLGSIRRESLVVKNISEQISVYRDGFKKSIKNEETALKTANQELLKKRTLLSPEAFAEERRKFEQKVGGLQRMVQQSKQALDQARANAMIEVEKALNKIITKLAEQRGIHLILNRDVAILTSRSLEITAEVLKQLDTQLPKVKVQKPVAK